MTQQRSWFDYLVLSLHKANRNPIEEVEVDIVGNREFISYTKRMFEDRYGVDGDPFLWSEITTVKVPSIAVFNFIENESIKGFQFNIKE